MLRIEHVAFWTEDIERLVSFYAMSFGARTGPMYINAKRGYESRFLSFDGGARIELMKSSKIAPVVLERGAQRMGLTHLAVSVGSEQCVDELTSRLKKAGHTILDGPRHTGDGYYESVVLDRDGNRIEVTV